MMDYDLIIIGAGVSGYGAALYAGRFNLKTLVLGNETGGIINSASKIENYPGIEDMDGIDLAEKIREHAFKFGSELMIDNVESVAAVDDGFEVKTVRNTYTAGSIIFATGARPRRLGIPGEKEFWGNGVHKCAICDAWIYKGKNVAVVGGSDSAAKEALILAEHAQKVYIIYRKHEIRAEPINKARVEANPKIEIIPDTNVIEAKGDKKLTHVVLDTPYKGSKDFPVDGLFIEIGYIPRTDLAKQLGVKLDEKGAIITDQGGRTNIPGIFAAGDVISFPFKQAITGVAQGVTAAHSAYEYLG